MSEVLVNNTQLQYFLNKCDSRFATVNHSHSWSNITGKPSSFPPSTHTHTKSQITDFPTYIDSAGVLDISNRVNLQGKTIQEFRDFLQEEYLSNNLSKYKVLNVICAFAFIDQWNAGNTDYVIQAGPRGLLKPLALYDYNTYASFQLSTYSSNNQGLYVFSLINGVWTNIEKISIVGHSHTFSNLSDCSIISEEAIDNMF